jgi:ribonucleotide reductase alpha subunit
VFDCAFRPSNGTRTIHYMGHIRMMGAVQPFLSGAISKTVNMPTTATPQDIEQAYLEAWRLGLKALDAEARARFGARFDELGAWAQDALLKLAEAGELTDAAWAGMPSRLFFHKRVLPDVVKAYYAHPTAWNEIGFGGPASPRGYVRMGFDRRDPWEAVEAHGHD